MARNKKKRVTIEYDFDIVYQHPDHLERIITDLIQHPGCAMSGAGKASDNNTYSYSYDRAERGRVVGKKK